MGRLPSISWPVAVRLIPTALHGHVGLALALRESLPASRGRARRHGPEGASTMLRKGCLCAAEAGACRPRGAMWTGSAHR